MKKIIPIFILSLTLISFNSCLDGIFPALLSEFDQNQSSEPSISDKQLATIGDQIITILPDMYDAYGYEEEIASPLVKPEGCGYIAEGLIEYWQSNSLIAVISFGNGNCDNVAVKTVYNGNQIVKEVEFYLDKDYNSDNSGYDKKIIKPLVKPDNCDYITEGTIQYIKDGKVIATVDYGNGACDEWATKTWDGGSKVFSLKK